MQETVNKDVNVTYDTLFDILRREKSREDLQELQESFFVDVVDYLKDKTRIMETSQGKLFSEEEMDKTRLQIMNIRKILRELYERREKKIISMALNKSRTKSSLINTSVLLKEEREFYAEINTVLDRFRQGILENVLEKKHPKVNKIETREIRQQDSPAIDGQPVSSVSGETSPKELKKDPDKKTKTVRFLNPMPKFIGPDMVIYGPFDEEDIANLPEGAADVLIEKGRAELLGNESGS